MKRTIKITLFLLIAIIMLGAGAEILPSFAQVRKIDDWTHDILPDYYPEELWSTEEGRERIELRQENAVHARWAVRSAMEKLEGADWEERPDYYVDDYIKYVEDADEDVLVVVTCAIPPEKLDYYKEQAGAYAGYVEFRNIGHTYEQLWNRADGIAGSLRSGGIVLAGWSVYPSLDAVFIAVAPDQVDIAKELIEEMDRTLYSGDNIDVYLTGGVSELRTSTEEPTDAQHGHEAADAAKIKLFRPSEIPYFYIPEEYWKTEEGLARKAARQEKAIRAQSIIREALAEKENTDWESRPDYFVGDYIEYVRDGEEDVLVIVTYHISDETLEYYRQRLGESAAHVRFKPIGHSMAQLQARSDALKRIIDERFVDDNSLMIGAICEPLICFDAVYIGYPQELIGRLKDFTEELIKTEFTDDPIDIYMPFIEEDDTMEQSAEVTAGPTSKPAGENNSPFPTAAIIAGASAAAAAAAIIRKRRS